MNGNGKEAEPTRKHGARRAGRHAIRRGGIFAVLMLTQAACGASAVPDPRAAANAYADAASRGDADAIYEMMSANGKRARSRDDVRRMVAEERRELADQASDARAPRARVEATAKLRFADGEEASLELRDGAYRVGAAGAVPGGGKTPEQTLDQLRRALARRSYGALLRVLSASTRAAIERDMQTLVEGLERPESLEVRTSGDQATITVPGGHHVRIRREGGLWRVEDFD